MPFNYCPNCGRKYHNALKKNKNYECKFCKFVFYNNPKPVVNAFILHPDNQALLLVQRGIKPYKEYWGIPGGFMHFGENPKAALSRELKEELNVESIIGNVVGTYNEFYKNKGKENECYSTIVIVYSVNLLNVNSILPSDDIIKAEFFPVDKLPANIAFENQKAFLKQVLKEEG